MKNTFIVSLSLFLLEMAHAGGREAGPEIKQFNVLCPAKDICPKFRETFQKCEDKKKGKACEQFIDLYGRLSQEYDCQRNFDHHFIVPALWLCSADDQELSRYVKLVSNLKSKKGKSFFASKEFRNTLDGELSEEYFKKSEAAEKK